MSQEGSNVTYNADFVSVGCNRVSNCASWGLNNLVAFAASRFIGIYDPLVSAMRSFVILAKHSVFQKIQLIRTIPAHSDRVNSVVWLPRIDEDSSEEEIELASSSVDKTIKIWMKDGEDV